MPLGNEKQELERKEKLRPRHGEGMRRGAALAEGELQGPPVTVLRLQPRKVIPPVFSAPCPCIPPPL